MLSQIENSFSKSELKVKLQLLILPLFCIYFYFYIFDSGLEDNIDTSNNLNNISTLVNKSFDDSYLNLIKEIEAFSLSKKIKIDSINYSKGKLLIRGKTSLQKINELIIKIEYINNFSKINSLSIEEATRSKQYFFKISSEFKKYYIKEKIEKVKKSKKKKIDNFSLKAIISNHILLNNKWYTIDDFVGKYKIVEIKKNLVILNYKDKNIKLRLSKYE